MRVYVYKNLHKDLWSLRALSGPGKGLVVAHASRLLLLHASFRVGQKGRLQVLRSGAKVVHAGVSGCLVACEGSLTPAGLTVGVTLPTFGPSSRPVAERLGDAPRITYNPRRFESFMRLDGDAPRPVFEATAVLFTPEGLRGDPAEPAQTLAA